MRLFFGHGDDAQHFVESGVAGLDLLPTALSEGAHAVFARTVRERARAFALQNQLVHFVVEAKDFEDPDPTAISGAPATIAADRRFEHLDSLRFLWITAQDREILQQLDLGNRSRARTLGAESS